MVPGFSLTQCRDTMTWNFRNNYYCFYHPITMHQPQKYPSCTYTCMSFFWKTPAVTMIAQITPSALQTPKVSICSLASGQILPFGFSRHHYTIWRQMHKYIDNYVDMAFTLGASVRVSNIMLLFATVCLFLTASASRLPFSERHRIYILTFNPYRSVLFSIVIFTSWSCVSR